jgi:hypothetical protein
MVAVPRDDEEPALQVYDVLEIHHGDQMREVWRGDCDGISGEVFSG